MGQITRDLNARFKRGAHMLSLSSGALVLDICTHESVAAKKRKGHDRLSCSTANPLVWPNILKLRLRLHLYTCSIETITRLEDGTRGMPLLLCIYLVLQGATRYVNP